MQVSPVVHFRTGVATHPFSSDTNPIFPNPSNIYDELTHDKIFEPTDLSIATSNFNVVALLRRPRFIKLFCNRKNSPHYTLSCFRGVFGINNNRFLWTLREHLSIAYYLFHSNSMKHTYNKFYLQKFSLSLWKVIFKYRSMFILHIYKNQRIGSQIIHHNTGYYIVCHLMLWQSIE